MTDLMQMRSALQVAQNILRPLMDLPRRPRAEPLPGLPRPNLSAPVPEPAPSATVPTAPAGQQTPTPTPPRRSSSPLPDLPPLSGRFAPLPELPSAAGRASSLPELPASRTSGTVAPLPDLPPFAGRFAALPDLPAPSIARHVTPEVTALTAQAPVTNAPAPPDAARVTASPLPDLPAPAGRFSALPEPVSPVTPRVLLPELPELPASPRGTAAAPFSPDATQTATRAIPDLPPLRGRVVSLPDLPSVQGRDIGAPLPRMPSFESGARETPRGIEGGGGNGELLQALQALTEKIGELIEQNRTQPKQPGPQADGSFVPSMGRPPPSQSLPAHQAPPRTTRTLAEAGNGPWQLHVSRNRGGA